MQPDVDQLRAFVRTVFKYASPQNIVSLRAFPQSRGGRPVFVRPFEIEAGDDLKSIIVGAVAGAREASKRNAVFSPPIASFRDVGKAGESDLVEGFTVSVECDAFPQTALAKLSEVIGSPTLVVASGGQWTNSETGKVQDKVHLHWLLRKPAADAPSLTKLKQARAFATAIAGADPSCVPVNHPMRWPGSWHLKNPNEPRLCRIVEQNENEIELEVALELLRAAAPYEVEIPSSRVTTRGEMTRPRDPQWSLETPADLDVLVSALRVIPNGDAGWFTWKNMGLRIYASTYGDDEGFKLFDAWSKRSTKYDAANTRTEWENIHRSPPTRTGADKIFAIAREHGWRKEPMASRSPTLTPETTATLTKPKRKKALPHRDAVAQIEDEIQFFIDNVVINGERNPFIDYGIELKTGRWDSPRSWAVVGPPGTYKSSITRKLIAERIKSGLLQKAIFFVPRLKFAEEYVVEFAKLGIRSAVLRGRSAFNEDGRAMCWELSKVAVAQSCGVKVWDHVCKACPHFRACPYSQQMEDEAQIWIAASNYLFHEQAVLKGANCVVIDEGFHTRGIIDDLERHAIPLDVLAQQNGAPGSVSQQLLRRTLYNVLRHQEQDGGVEQDAIIEAFGEPWEGEIIGYADELKRAELAERKSLSLLLPQLKLSEVPASKRGLHRLMRSELVRDIAHTQTMIKVWRELHEFVHVMRFDQDESQIRSGRVILETIKSNEKRKFLVWRGISRITDQFQLPTLLLNVEHEGNIIQNFIPQIESPVIIDVALPAATKTIQVFNAPTTKTKLGDPDPRKPNFEARLRAVEANRQEVLTYIVKQWRNLEKPKAAVFCQLDFRKWLEAKLPEGIAVDHFGNVAGTNDYADIGLEFIVGRALPGPKAVETAASTLSGLQVQTIVDPDPKVFSWYLPARGEIILRSGETIGGRGHRHPNELANANLRSILSELQQAMGRARPWGRDEANPLTVHLLLDEAIPSSIVDEIQHWLAVGPFDSLIEDGILLTSEVDLMKLWPEIFTSIRTTRRYVKKLQAPSGWLSFEYRPRGRRGRLSMGWYDPNRDRDLQSWMVQQIGPLSNFALSDQTSL